MGRNGKPWGIKALEIAVSVGGSVPESGVFPPRDVSKLRSVAMLTASRKSSLFGFVFVCAVVAKFACSVFETFGSDSLASTKAVSRDSPSGRCPRNASSGGGAGEGVARGPFERRG